MGDENDDAERIRREMQHVRQVMGDDLKGIVLGARQLSDWRYYVKQHPWACLGAAFALGFLLMPGKRVPAQVEIEKLLDQLRSSTKTAKTLGGSAGSGLLGRLIGLAAPVVVRGATAFVSNQLSGARRNAELDSDPVPTHEAFGDEQ